MLKTINTSEILRKDVLKVNIAIQEKRLLTEDNENYITYIKRDLRQMKAELKNIESFKKYSDD